MKQGVEGGWLHAVPGKPHDRENARLQSNVGQCQSEDQQGCQQGQDDQHPHGTGKNPPAYVRHMPPVHQTPCGDGGHAAEAVIQRPDERGCISPAGAQQRGVQHDMSREQERPQTGKHDESLMFHRGVHRLMDGRVFPGEVVQSGGKQQPRQQKQKSKGRDKAGAERVVRTEFLRLAGSFPCILGLHFRRRGRVGGSQDTPNKKPSPGKGTAWRWL